MQLSSIRRLAALVLGVCLLGAVPAAAQDGVAPLSINISGNHSAVQIVVPQGKSRLVQFDRSFRQIVVGSKDIAHIVTLSHNRIYILGKKRGTTNLTITDYHHNVVAVVDVVVTYDVDGLAHQLNALVPDADVDITPAGNALVLSGHVNSADDLHKIVAVAERYAPGAITNLLKVGGSQQVMLEVKFDEVERSAVQDLGVSVLNGNSFNKGSISGTSVLPAALGEFGTYGGFLTDLNSYELTAKLQALATKGLVKTLAEPNLVALSGHSASFDAGGEFPVPVVQSSTGTIPTTTVQFKNFGVGLSFTPTVTSIDQVNLVIKSEVSSIDKAASATANGIDVPGLKVRRANTTVEMRDGQTFAIAGLIQNDFQDTMTSIPGLGDIPILGSLFRSTNFQNNQSELVVFITVHLVQPVDGRKLVSPNASVEKPTNAELDLLGRREHNGPPPPSAAPQMPPSAMPEPPQASTAPQTPPSTTPAPPQAATKPDNQQEGYVLP